MKHKFTFIAVLLFLMGSLNVFSQQDEQKHDLRAKFSLSDVIEHLDPETQKLIELRALKDSSISEDATTPAPAIRGVVWDNGGDDGTGTGLGSQLDADFPFSAQVADDFLFDSEVEIHAVQWWGQFFNLGVPSPATTEFNIIFYEDDGSENMPTGAGMDDPTPTAVAVYNFPEVTGTTVGADRYEYQVNLPDIFIAEADQKYWIAIQWVGTFDAIGQWGWVTNGENPNQLSESVQGFPLLDTDYWENTEEGDMAFRLYDEPFEPPPPPDEGSDCTDPIVVDAFPFEDLGQTTCGMENTYSNTCLGLYDGGEDIHYQFTLTEELFVTITLDPKETTYTGMLLTDVCPPPAADCIATVQAGFSTDPQVIEEVLQPGTYYIMISTWPAPNCIPDFDLTITATTDLPPPSYCDAGPSSTFDSNVENVFIEGENDTEIDHDGCDPAVTGVEDLTDQVVDLYPGETYTLFVEFGTCGTISYAGAGSVWIDWDQDFEFGNGDDLIHESTGTPGTAPWDGPVEISFTVPADAAPGNTVMRVMQQEGGSLPMDPCATFSWGSVMDFGVQILEDEEFARAQIIHNSALVGEVDVFVNDDPVPFLTNVGFRQATPFLDVPAGVELELDIAPAGAGIGASVFNTTVEFDGGETYIVVAAGDLDDKGTSFDLFIFDQGQEEATAIGNTDVLAFHGSTDAPTVSVWETAFVDAPIISDFAFGDFAGYIELFTEDYILEVRDAAGETTIAAYLAPLATLELEGQALVVLASGFLNPPDEKSSAPEFSLFVALPDGGDLIPLPLEEEEDPVPVPLSSWAIYLGVLLMISFVIIRFRRII